MKKEIFTYTKGMTDNDTIYCPGCTHGIAHRLVAEALEEMGLLEKAIGVTPIGCSVMAHQYMNVDMCEAAHGRAPAVATGIRRVHPDKTVFTYQGDGDLASIGMAEIVYAAQRGEKITTFFINNGIFGMTGGQMAPTTLIGQRATTCQEGRVKEVNGMPLKICEMLSTIDGAVYLERVSLSSPANVRKAKKAVLKALEVQQQGLGFSLVEFISSCPTNWGMTPQAALKRIDEEVTKYYPLGCFRTPEEVK